MSEMHAIFLLVIGLAVLLSVCYEMHKTHELIENQKMRQRMRDREKQLAAINALIAQERLQQQIEKEKQDVSPIVVPVTAAERNERRRIMRLYNN